MRYPRHAKIFRGQLDMAPLANVLFLLLIFVLLGSLLYTPGIPYRLEAGVHRPLSAQKVVIISRQGEIIFENKTNKIDDLAQLRVDFKSLPAGSTVVVKADAAAPKEIILHVRDEAKNSGLSLETPEIGIELPPAAGLSGTPNPTVVVAVNFGGQFFYENRLVTEKELRAKLEDAARKGRGPMTLLVLADKSVQNETLMRLGEMALAVGFKDMMLGARPAKR